MLNKGLRVWGWAMYGDDTRFMIVAHRDPASHYVAPMTRQDLRQRGRNNVSLLLQIFGVAAVLTAGLIWRYGILA